MKSKKILLVISGLIVLAVIALVVTQILYLRKAHSTFENYYAFRGCTKLIKRTSTYGICQLANGQTIKIVKFNGKWYLDGDLPWACVGKVCFGI